MMTRLLLSVLSACVTVLAGSTSIVAAAQTSNYPNKPIQLVIPFGPGAVNTAGAIVAEKMSQYLGQPLVLMNKPGAGGALGAQQVAASPADGYTLLAIVPAFVTAPLTNKDLQYKISEFVPVGQFARFSHYLVVRNDFPAKTLPELVAHIKSNPGKTSYGGSGIGGAAYLLIETLKLNRNLSTQFVPYPVETAAISALLGGHIDFVAVSSTAIDAQIRSGTVRPLATFLNERDPLLPQVPTALEQGFPELVATGYIGMAAPAKTPPAVVKKLEEAMERAVGEKKVQEMLLQTGTSAQFRGSADLGAFFIGETKKWADMGATVGAGK
jgi:tripartite-type tricarboxylate transporter receptor subunit TctC